jgi:hypothetical protein
MLSAYSTGLGTSNTCLLKRKGDFARGGLERYGRRGRRVLRGGQEMRPSRFRPGRLDRRQSPIVCPTSLPAARRATRPGAIRSCLVAGFTSRASGGRRPAVWPDGAPALTTPRVGGHAQSRPRNPPTACCNAHHHAMAQRENWPSGQLDSGTHRDALLARRVI